MSPGEWSAGTVLAAMAAAVVFGYFIGARDFGCVTAAFGGFMMGFTAGTALGTWGF